MRALERCGLSRCLAFASMAAVLGATAVAAASTDAGVPVLPPFPGQCSLSDIEKPCAAQGGLQGTCVAASCEYTPDGGDSHGCEECAICVGANPMFPRCTDTIACAPGFSCFVYGDPELITGVGSPVSPLGWWRIYARDANCFEGGAGPQYAPAWSPCNANPSQVVGSMPDAGAWAGTYDDASVGQPASSAPGATGSGSGAGPGAGGAGSPAAPAVPVVEAADAAAGRPTIEVLRGTAGCAVAGPAAMSLPWLVLLPLGVLRGRKRRGH